MAKKVMPYYVKIVVSLLVTFVFAGFFVSKLTEQIKKDKEFSGVNSRNIGMATALDEVMSKDDSELDDAGKAEKRVLWAFEHIRNGRFDEALEFISKIEANQYLKDNKPSIREYFIDFKNWYTAYKGLEGYYNLQKNVRKKTTEPAAPKAIQAFIKSGACESYFGDKKSEYASLIPYQQFKLMNMLFKNHIPEKEKDAFIEKHTGAEAYKAYIDTFINGKESLSAEDGNVICGYVYASYIATRVKAEMGKVGTADKEKPGLKALRSEIEGLQTGIWKADLGADNGKLSAASRYLKTAYSTIGNRIDSGFGRDGNEKNKLVPYTEW